MERRERMEGEEEKGGEGGKTQKLEVDNQHKWVELLRVVCTVANVGGSQGIIELLQLLERAEDGIVVTTKLERREGGWECGGWLREREVNGGSREDINS